MEFTSLPAEGPDVAVPAWPLSPRATRRENAIWAREWARPQAVMWQRYGLETEVAIYVRMLRGAEKPGVTAAILGEVRRRSDALGLTVAGLRANRWLISEMNAAARDDAQRATGTENVAAKSRWKPEVLDGGVGS